MPQILLKQFVPSTVCLKCDGCCRYKEPASPWRPKLGPLDQGDLASIINAQGVMDDQGYITTIKACGQDICRFLNGTDNTCGIYSQRPFECSLYPFILSQTPEMIRVYVHLSCPYVQDYLPHAGFEAHVLYLKEFFNRSETREFLSRNKAMLHDYSAFAVELLHLFDILPL